MRKEDEGEREEDEHRDQDIEGSKYKTKEEGEEVEGSKYKIREEEEGSKYKIREEGEGSKYKIREEGKKWMDRKNLKGENLRQKMAWMFTRKIDTKNFSISHFYINPFPPPKPRFYKTAQMPYYFFNAKQFSKNIIFNLKIVFQIQKFCALEIYL